jgi:hypothetical protein
MTNQYFKEERFIYDERYSSHKIIFDNSPPAVRRKSWKLSKSLKTLSFVTSTSAKSQSVSSKRLDISLLSILGI